MKNLITKRGISLIVLIITIAVVIILAAAVILSMNNNRPIESAKTATKKNDDANLKESASVLAAQWKVDQLLDESIGTRTSYVQDGLKKQGFSQDAINRVVINEETGEVSIINDANAIDEFAKIKKDIIANPSKYLDQASTLGQNITSNKDIGIGTDGKVVNLDIWNYELKDGSMSLPQKGVGSNSTPSYSGEVVDGKIQGTIPQVIYLNDTKSCYDVTSLYWTFSGYKDGEACSTDLIYAPVIPSSVTDMSNTFDSCKSLTTAPVIPNNVTNMSSTFSGCTSLTTAPVIPNSVIDMSGTFAYCASLTTAPVIPNGVTDMSATFYGCSSLTTATTIPESVENMAGTFINCAKLTGRLEINANPNIQYGSNAGEDNVFSGASIAEGAHLVLTGSSTMLNEMLATKSSNSNITIE